MNASVEIPGQILFTREAIQEHLQKILNDRIFDTSEILKRFLSFIVNETIEGRSYQLKEYTIGVSVLNKSVDFKPQQDAIVRIHASRLRRALNHYYNESGALELLRITMPKGSYVPFISEANTEINARENGIDSISNYSPIITVIAVMPFAYHEKKKSAISIVEGLAAQLTTELAQKKNLTVISYYTMRRLSKKIFDIREILASVGAQYVFTGDIQQQDGRLRINIQLINTLTNEQTWSEVYERKLTATNMFEIQDDIVGQIVSVFNNYSVADRPKLTIAS